MKNKYLEDWIQGIGLLAVMGSPTKEYRAAVVTRVQERKQIEPEPDADVMWCGAQ